MEKEERCNDCREHSDQGNRERKGSDSGITGKEKRDNSGKLSLILIGALLVCCALPLILVSAGVGIAAYSFLKGWNMILIIASILLLIFAVFASYHRKHETKTLIASGEEEQRSPEVTARMHES